MRCMCCAAKCFDYHRWYNRVGCVCDGQLRPAYKAVHGSSDGAAADASSLGLAANGINFFWSVIGSLLYLLGSIA
jgi:hypothetical protein